MVTGPLNPDGNPQYPNRFDFAIVKKRNEFNLYKLN
jgi:hypothetical protein